MGCCEGYTACEHDSATSFVGTVAARHNRHSGALAVKHGLVCAGMVMLDVEAPRLCTDPKSSSNFSGSTQIRGGSVSSCGVELLARDEPTSAGQFNTGGVALGCRARHAVQAGA